MINDQQVKKLRSDLNGGMRLAAGPSIRDVREDCTEVSKHEPTAQRSSAAAPLANPNRSVRVRLDIDDSIRWRSPRSVKLLNQQEFAYCISDSSSSLSIAVRIFGLSHFFVGSFVVD